MKHLFTTFFGRLVSRVSVAMVALFLMNQGVVAQSDSIARGEKAFDFDFLYTGDFVANMAGGYDQGVAYVGAGTLGFSFDPEKANWYKGGLLRVTGKATHGKSPSETLFGDKFFVDNADAGNHVYLYEMWYRQNFNDKFDFTIGLQDINTNFATHGEAVEFINTAIVMSTIYSNVGTPTFPMTGLGLELGYNINDNWRVQACIYDGSVGFIGKEHNLPRDWKLNKQDGYLIAAEGIYSSETAGDYRLGIDYHTGADDAGTGAQRFGIYANGEKQVGIAKVFAVAAFAPRWKDSYHEAKKNDIYTMINVGVTFHSIFAKRYEDMLGFSCVANLLNKYTTGQKHETIFELTYKYRALRMLYVQPDLQLVLKPALHPTNKDGEENKAAFGLFVRCGIEL